MDEEILEATNALCLSPRRDKCKRSGSSLVAFDSRFSHTKPFAAIRSNRSSFGSGVDKLSSAAAIVKLPLEAISDMARGVKRPRRESQHAGSRVADSTSPSKLAKLDHNDAGSVADVPIIISDSDEADDHSDSDQYAAETATEVPSPTASHRAKLANLYTYHSPTKAKAAERSEPKRPPKLEKLPSETSAPDLFGPPASSRMPPPTTLKATASASTLSKDGPLSAGKKSKKSKSLPRATIQLKRTLEAAKERGVAPLDLERVSAAGFRLMLRCSFCAGAFAKSTSAKAKQQHMSLCAPLQGVERSAAAVDTISSDITSALRRDEQDKQKAQDERTVLQDVMHDADIIMHEGRASQIASSSKKRGRDKVITKRPIKRAAKPMVLVAEDPSSHPSPAPRPAGHNLLPAHKAMLAARDIANKLLGSAISFLVDSNETGESEEAQDATAKHEEPSGMYSVADPPATPTRRRKIAFSHGSDDLDDQVNHLPVVSAEHIFASMASASPQKSPVKALQKSRERQLSREQDTSLETEDPSRSPASPNLPQTQPFAPSKLAQRQRARGDRARDQLFGAQTTTRSLLDLMPNDQDADASDTSSESKRKADEVNQASNSASTKRPRADELDRFANLETPSTYSKAALKGQSRSSGSRYPDGSNMEIDDLTTKALPAHSGKGDRSSSGKLQDPFSFKPARVLAESTDLIDKTNPQVSSDLQQTARNDHSAMKEIVTLRDRDDNPFEDADSLDEDESEKDDDDDSQSFLDMLEPLRVLDEPTVSQTQDLSEPSSDDMDQAEAEEAANRSRRMLVACGGASISIEYRRSTRLAPLHNSVPSSSTSFTLLESRTKASPNHETRESSVSNSDPDLVLISDDSRDSSLRP